MSVLECRNLTKKYGNLTALDNIDLTLEPGRIVGLVDGRADPDRRSRAGSLDKGDGLLSSRQGFSPFLDECRFTASFLYGFLSGF